jgi:hypothetical protein
VPEDVGGRPFSDGEEPESQFAHGGDEEFAAVVFDEDFVNAATIHEPSAVERMVAAAEARAEAEAAALDASEYDAEDGYSEDPDDPEHDEYGPYGRYGGRLRPYRGHPHWQRPVALLLAVVMGVGIVALVFTAVYRSGSAGDDTPPPSGPQSTSTSADSSVPEASAVPR